MLWEIKSKKRQKDKRLRWLHEESADGPKVVVRFMAVEWRESKPVKMTTYKMIYGCLEIYDFWEIFKLLDGFEYFILTRYFLGQSLKMCEKGKDSGRDTLFCGYKRWSARKDK